MPFQCIYNYYSYTYLSNHRGTEEGHLIKILLGAQCNKRLFLEEVTPSYILLVREE